MDDDIFRAFTPPQVDNHGQIKPAFTGAKIRNVTHSLLLRAAGVKVLLQQIL